MNEILAIKKKEKKSSLVKRGYREWKKEKAFTIHI